MLQPSPQECEALARKAFPGRQWADLTDTDRAGLLDEWRIAQQVEERMAAAAPPRGLKDSKEIVTRLFESTKGFLERNLQPIAFNLERLDLRTKRADDRIDGLYKDFAKLRAGPHAYVSALEHHIAELSARLKALEDKIR